MHSLTKILPYSVFVKDSEQISYLLKSDLNIINFPVGFAPLNNLDIKRNLVFFSIKTFVFINASSNGQKFFLLSLKVLFIISITSAPFTIH